MAKRRLFTSYRCGILLSCDRWFCLHNMPCTSRLWPGVTSGIQTGFSCSSTSLKGFLILVWTVGFYWFPKSKLFNTNISSSKDAPTMILRSVLYMVLLNLKPNSCCGLWLYSFPCDVNTDLFAKWRPCLCFFVYFYIVYRVCRLHASTLIHSSCCCKGEGGPVYITVPLGQRWMGLRWNLAEPPSVNERPGQLFSICYEKGDAAF